MCNGDLGFVNSSRENDESVNSLDISKELKGLVHQIELAFVDMYE
jgi:hypothetical protein